jgi:hypothetical protein
MRHSVQYAYVTFWLIVYKNSPFFGPLSGLVSFCLPGMLRVFFHLPRTFHRNHRLVPVAYPVHFFSHSLRETAEDYARRLHHNIDYRALWWTFKSLDEDGELQEFLGGILDLLKLNCCTKCLFRLHLTE